MGIDGKLIVGVEDNIVELSNGCLCCTVQGDLPRRRGTPVHAIALRAQIRIEPQRRRYRSDETEALVELFGEPGQWGDSLRPFSWTHVSTTVSSFTGVTEIDLPITCTYDFEVSGTRYFHSLADGEIPLLLLFSGTTFVAGADGLSVTPIAWHEEASYRFPVSVWQAMMDAHYPNRAFVTVSRETLDSLLRFRAAVPSRRGTWSSSDSSRKPGSERGVTDRFVAARAVADAVLYEGYVLYPYRASAPKNQIRWQWGVLFPRTFAEADGSERWRNRTECIVDPGSAPQLTVQVRGLHVQRRSIEAARGAGRASWCPSPSWRSTASGGCRGTRPSNGSSIFPTGALLPLGAASCEERIDVPGGEARELPCRADGTVLGSRDPPA